ncbi:SGNH/GDSL hydrolase family protein [Georgenia sp. 10Sc9-8]|uniref:SGNH/GDSL hydrolase family protein n=1 Tax=Georgenia halotolerans TaxID=3028317 RepID=A0ABT5TZX0_9MICO|nr:SGNH/GDSL hydrolase family protein [Georgenia halotolerans]
MHRRPRVVIGALVLAALALIVPAQAADLEGPPVALHAAAKPAAAGASAGASAKGSSSAPAAPAAAGRPDGVGNAAGWYLQLGDSLAAGYQPDRGEDLTGGYADDVLGALREDAGKTKLENISCPGETVVTMMDGGRCDYPKGSQLDQALHFLHAHGDKTRAIAVTIGANDVVSCVLTGSLDEECLVQGLAEVNERLPQVLGALREAAPDAEIVVTNYYNPILAFWLQGSDGQALAEQSMGLQDQLNSIIAGAAASADAEVADVAAAFESDNLTPVDDVPGAVPTNVARLCELTWMCEAFDIHANTEGYDLIGEAVAVELTA